MAQQQHESHLNKLVSLDSLVTKSVALKRQGLKIVLSNGCFDLLHVGHILSLQQARRFGNVHVVAMNSDASVRRLKGPDRPIWPSAQRAQMLAELPCVDTIVEFDRDTPHEIILALQPDVLVKGGNYQPEQVIGHELLSQWGGRVEIVELVEGVSTTKIVSSILRGGSCPIAP